MSDQSMILWLIGAILTVTGLSGLLLPVVPGAPVLFLGLLLGAWAEDFQYIGLWTLLVLAALAVLTYVVEFAASVLGAKRYGGSKRAMAGAAVGGIVGLFLGIPGVLFGPFVGAVIGELSLQRSLDEASRAGFGTVVGLAIGLAGKFAIGIAMIGLFILKRFI
ncbi:DUF456 domain-containing protein [Geobacter sp. SVR]|uniref:DUF456 domain-containing protein n=1 Tax=Geobacter sp. SVR TaxID=2495594 RepID=UPI00156520DB|nr:DUF456 domain-containing protein [Geobacter sp. SVR]